MVTQSPTWCERPLPCLIAEVGTVVKDRQGKVGIITDVDLVDGKLHYQVRFAPSSELLIRATELRGVNL